MMPDFYSCIPGLHRFKEVRTVYLLRLALALGLVLPVGVLADAAPGSAAATQP